MCRTVASSIAIITLVSWCIAGDNPPKKSDADAIQGEWKITYFEEQGEVDPPQNYKTTRWNFGDGKLTINVDGKAVTEGKYQLDPTQKPPHIDAKYSDEEAPGIYKLEGDTLTICAPAFRGKGERPKEFKAPKGSRLMLIKFERVKK